MKKQSGKNTARHLGSRERQLLIIKLRIAGKPLESIARAVGCSRSYAGRVVRVEMARRATELSAESESLRIMELERIDRLIERTFPLAIGRPGRPGEPVPDYRVRLLATDRILRAISEKSKLLGLALPEQGDQTSQLASDVLAMFDRQLAKVYGQADDEEDPDAGPLGLPGPSRN